MVPLSVFWEHSPLPTKQYRKKDKKKGDHFMQHSCFIVTKTVLALNISSETLFGQSIPTTTCQQSQTNMACVTLLILLVSSGTPPPTQPHQPLRHRTSRKWNWHPLASLEKYLVGFTLVPLDISFLLLLAEAYGWCYASAKSNRLWNGKLCQRRQCEMSYKEKNVV